MEELLQMWRGREFQNDKSQSRHVGQPTNYHLLSYVRFCVCLLFT